jgi:hypothetical protein
VGVGDLDESVARGRLDRLDALDGVAIIAATAIPAARDRRPHGLLGVTLVTAFATAVASAATVSLGATRAAPEVGGRRGGRRPAAVEQDGVRLSVEPAVADDAGRA